MLPTSNERVKEFWERQACGEVYASGDTLEKQLETQALVRHALEPVLREFARFDDASGRDVLEIGVGMGADHLQWARARPRVLVGIDLTSRAVRFTHARLLEYGYAPRVAIANAEELPFADNSFDLAYSWGVLHHAANTKAAVQELWRVLKPNGCARVMIYHKHSIVGYLLWIRYALLKGRPRRTLEELYSQHLESPGTKAYTVDEGRRLFERFSSVEARSALSLADLMQGLAGDRHGGRLLGAVRLVWPRWLIRRLLPDHGLDLLIEAVK